MGIKISHERSGILIVGCSKGIRTFRGLDKNQIGKGVLVGPGSRACHVLLYSVYFNSILASGDNGRVIGLV